MIVGVRAVEMKTPAGAWGRRALGEGGVFVGKFAAESTRGRAMARMPDDLARADYARGRTGPPGTVGGGVKIGW